MNRDRPLHAQAGSFASILQVSAQVTISLLKYKWLRRAILFIIPLEGVLAVWVLYAGVQPRPAPGHVEG
jgi:hypothetical protein